MEAGDWPRIRRIYSEGIALDDATFETVVPSWEKWDKKFLNVARFVAHQDGHIVGWVALTPTSTRYAYRGVGEVSVYVDSQYHRKGIGKKLLLLAIDASEIAGFWTLQAGIFQENEGSIKLHEKVGFRIVGIREKVAQKNGVWRDTVIMERRSALVF